jgi:hypothetical protein
MEAIEKRNRKRKKEKKGKKNKEKGGQHYYPLSKLCSCLAPAVS